MTARYYFLQDNLSETFYYLGIALHYIQDSHTSVISYDSPNNRVWHQNYEQNIENSEFIYNLENRIQNFFHNNDYRLIRYSTLARNLAGKVEGKAATLRIATLVGECPCDQTGKPMLDLNMALLASLIVTESVLSSKTFPPLETKLKDVLLKHEEFLRDAEVASANDVIRLVKERDELIKKKVPPTGTVSKIKNWIIGVRISLKDRTASSRARDYFHRTHLEDVANTYRLSTINVVAPCEGWYNFQVPQINLNSVKKQLLSVREVADHLGVSESLFKEMLQKENAPFYNVIGKELLRRPDVDRFLNRFPLHGKTI